MKCVKCDICNKAIDNNKDRYKIKKFEARRLRNCFDGDMNAIYNYFTHNMDICENCFCEIANYIYKVKDNEDN